jgi:putative aldouronate transport system permease protein
MRYKKSRRTAGERVFSAVNNVIMLAVLLCVAYPFWYVIIYSFNDAADASKGGLTLIPRMFTLYNYAFLLKDPNIYFAYLITFARTFVGAVTSVFFTAMVSYAVSKRELVGRNIFLVVGTITLVFSAGMIPSYFVMQSLGMLNTFWVYIIPALYSFWSTLIFLPFFRNLPASIEESAQLDGANEFMIFIRIVLPLSMPIIATMLLFSGVGQYSDYFSTVLYANQNKKLYTIQYYLYKMIQVNNAITMAQHIPPAMQAAAASRTSATALKYSTMLLTSLPIMCVYPFVQKHFVKGVMIGSVKG